ncbi:MAG: DUF4835 family protein [Bacteroidia bacterium]
MLKLYYHKIFLITFLLSALTLSAQELNCSVKVNAQQVQGTDRRVFETLQNAIYEFMNNTRWTNDVFKVEERIECSIFINVTDRPSVDDFRATIQVQSRRPIFNSSYNSTILNYFDNDFQFKYIEYQPIEFSPTTFTSNLASVLAYYAYIIIALDYDTYSLEGGTKYYQIAQQIVNNAQNTSETGWKAFESDRNRYWYVENMLTQTFTPLRHCLYRYHRKGLDAMLINQEEARKEILEALKLIRSIHAIKPASFNVQLFFNSKADEIVNIFSVAYSDVKSQVITLMTEIDPGNLAKYQKLNQNR